MSLVIAWVTLEVEPVSDPHRRADLGARPATREIEVPRAAVWCHKPKRGDRERAEAHVAEELERGDWVRGAVFEIVRRHGLLEEARRRILEGES